MLTTKSQIVPGGSGPTLGNNAAETAARVAELLQQRAALREDVARKEAEAAQKAEAERQQAQVETPDQPPAPKTPVVTEIDNELTLVSLDEAYAVASDNAAVLLAATEVANARTELIEKVQRLQVGAKGRVESSQQKVRAAERSLHMAQKWEVLGNKVGLRRLCSGLNLALVRNFPEPLPVSPSQLPIHTPGCSTHTDRRSHSTG